MNELRAELSKTNKKLITLLSERKKISNKIQIKKKNTQSWSSFDYDQEVKVFTELKADLDFLALKELLSFSLIMESHAQSNDENHYPSWSRGEHLINAPKSIQEQINPILLKIIKPKLFSELQTNEKFGKYC